MRSCTIEHKIVISKWLLKEINKLALCKTCSKHNIIFALQNLPFVSKDPLNKSMSHWVYYFLDINQWNGKKGF